MSTDLHPWVVKNKAHFRLGSVRFLICIKLLTTKFVSHKSEYTYDNDGDHKGGDGDMIYWLSSLCVSLTDKN